VAATKSAPTNTPPADAPDEGKTHVSPALLDQNRPTQDDEIREKHERSHEGLYVVVANLRNGDQDVKLVDHTQAEALYRTYVRQTDDDGNPVEGGGPYELHERDVKVYKLSATEHTF
jgi:hypothetical protein